MIHGYHPTKTTIGVPWAHILLVGHNLRLSTADAAVDGRFRQERKVAAKRPEAEHSFEEN